MDTHEFRWADNSEKEFLPNPVLSYVIVRTEVRFWDYSEPRFIHFVQRAE